MQIPCNSLWKQAQEGQECPQLREKAAGSGTALRHHETITGKLLSWAVNLLHVKISTPWNANELEIRVTNFQSSQIYLLIGTIQTGSIETTINFFGPGGKACSGERSFF